MSKEKITITLDEYKELLEIKGKYIELKEKEKEKIVCYPYQANFPYTSANEPYISYNKCCETLPQHTNKC